MSEPVESQKSDERAALVIVAVILAPIIALILIGGYGLAVWILEIIQGPPGPH